MYSVGCVLPSSVILLQRCVIQGGNRDIKPACSNYHVKITDNEWLLRQKNKLTALKVKGKVVLFLQLLKNTPGYISEALLLPRHLKDILSHDSICLNGVLQKAGIRADQTPFAAASLTSRYGRQ